MMTGEQRPIGDIQVGDRLLGFDDAMALGANRCWREAVVSAVWRTSQPTVKITFEDGRQIIASANHKFLAEHRPYWREAESLHLASALVGLAPLPASERFSLAYMRGYVCGATAADGTARLGGPNVNSGKNGTLQRYWRVAEPDFDMAILVRLRSFLAELGVAVEIRPFSASRNPAHAFAPKSGISQPMSKVETRRADAHAVIQSCAVEGDLKWKAGYLAGCFDCDGGHHGSVRIAQLKDNDLLDNCVRYAKELGFDMRREHHNGGCPTVRLYGDSAEKARFFAAIRPSLVRKALLPICGERMAKLSTRVTGIERGPVMELVDITTTTGTFVASGIATHNCYAETFANRYGHDVWGKESARRFFGDKHWAEPLKWDRQAREAGERRRVFCASMADVFEDRRDLDEPRGRLWALIAATPWLDWLLLTKRPEMVNRLAPSAWADGFPRNVWVGTTAEDDVYARIRIRHLAKVPAVVRFVSVEPMLGPVDLSPWLADGSLSWTIVGAESGAGARPMDLSWVRDLRDQCQGAGVAFHVKQLSNPLSRIHPIRDVDRFPKDLRMRDYPEVVST